MKKYVLLFVAALAWGGVSQAGLFGDAIDLGDLATLPAESLETLKDAQFEVFLADVRLGAAKAAERRANDAVKGADRILGAENLDLKAANAEAKAAGLNEDPERLNLAQAQVQNAEADLTAAKALKKWKQKELDARQAETKHAKAAFDLAEARLDLAVVQLIKDENPLAAGSYDLVEFEKTVRKREKDYDNTRGKAEEQVARARQLQAEWERVSKETTKTTPPVEG